MSNKKESPFDHFKRINSSIDKPDDLETYNAYLCEIYYSNYYDTCLYAEFVSMMDIPDEMHETFMRGLVEKGNRKHFWPKSKKSDKIELLKDFFDISHDKALEISEFIPNSIYSKIENVRKKQ